MSKFIAVPLVLLAIVAAGYGTYEHIQADHAVVEAVSHPLDPGTLTEPMINGGQWRVNCGTVDGGVATDALVPMDGGTVDVRVAAVYVAPCAANSTGCTASPPNIRVGFSGDMSGGLTSATGYEVGTTGRDGPGVPMDARQRLFCKSEGAAIQADVVAGRN